MATSTEDLHGWGFRSTMEFGCLSESEKASAFIQTSPAALADRMGKDEHGWYKKVYNSTDISPEIYRISEKLLTNSSYRYWYWPDSSPGVPPWEK